MPLWLSRSILTNARLLPIWIVFYVEILSLISSIWAVLGHFGLLLWPKSFLGWAWAKKVRPKANLGRRPLGRLWAWANLGPSWYIGPGRFGLGRARPKPIPTFHEKKLIFGVKRSILQFIASLTSIDLKATLLERLSHVLGSSKHKISWSFIAFCQQVDS